MPKPTKTSSHTHAVGAWGKEMAFRLLKESDSGFSGPTLHDGYVLAVAGSVKYLFAVAARDELQEDGTANLNFNVYPDEVMAAAREIGAVPAWLTIPINRKKCTFSAFWGLVTQLPKGRNTRYAIGVPMKSTAGYTRLAADVVDPTINDIFTGKR